MVKNYAFLFPDRVCLHLFNNNYVYSEHSIRKATLLHYALHKLPSDLRKLKTDILSLENKIDIYSKMLVQRVQAFVIFKDPQITINKVVNPS